MKIAGRSSFKQTGEFSLGTFGEGEDASEVKVTLTSLALGFERVLEGRITSPRAPVQPIIDPRTNKPQRDVKNRPLLAPDTQDPAFKQAAARSNSLQAVATLWHGMRGDPRAEFATEPPADNATSAEWGAFYEAIYDEFRAADVPMGRIIAGATAVAQLSGVDSKSVEEAMETFT